MKVSVRESLSHVTLPVSDVLTTLLHLNPSKSPGPDGIPSPLLKNLAPQISIITCIFNKCLNDGIFPRKRRSWLTQLLQFVHTMAKSLDDGIDCDVIFLYTAKAFDKNAHAHARENCCIN